MVDPRSGSTLVFTKLTVGKRLPRMIRRSELAGLVTQGDVVEYRQVAGQPDVSVTVTGADKVVAEANLPKVGLKPARSQAAQP
jgi:hypothetical protein